MKVSRIKWLSKLAQEALLTVTDGTHEIDAYCQPCEFSVGEEVSKPLQTLGVEDVRRVENDLQPSATRRPAGLGYEIVGEVVDNKSQRICVGNISIECDLPLPRDIANGEIVRFFCDRIDVWSPSGSKRPEHALK